MKSDSFLGQLVSTVYNVKPLCALKGQLKLIYEEIMFLICTLESGMNVPHRIKVAPGKFGKKNKHSPIYTLYLYYLNRLYEVWNKAVAPGKKSKN